MQRARHAESVLSVSETCLNLFVDRGTVDVTVEELAAAAGISRRTFHRYFESKEAAIQPVLYQGMGLMAAALAAAPEELGLVDSLVTAFSAAADGPYRQRTRALMPLLDATNGMRAVWSQAIDDGEAALTTPVARRMHVADGSVDARLTTAVITTLIRKALLDSSAKGTDPIATFREYARRVLAAAEALSVSTTAR